MKTFNLIFILCSFAFVLSSCGGKHSYKNYQEAIKANDFAAAHEFISDFKKDFEKVYEDEINSFWGANKKKIFAKSNTLYNAINEVYNAEITYLMEAYDDIEIEKKFTFLLTQIPRYHSGDRDIDSRLYEDWNRCDFSICSSTIDIAMSFNKYETARTAISRGYSNNLEESTLIKKLIEKLIITDDNFDFLFNYVTSTGYYSESLRNYLIKKNNTIGNEFLIEKISKDRGHTYTHETLPTIGKHYDKDEGRYYHECAQNYNEYYARYVTNALSLGNKELAKQILPFFKKDILFEETDDACIVTKHITTEAELESIKKVEQAFASNRSTY